MIYPTIFNEDPFEKNIAFSRDFGSSCGVLPDPFR